MFCALNGERICEGEDVLGVELGDDADGWLVVVLLEVMSPGG